MVTKIADEVLSKVKHLCYTQGFVYEFPSNSGHGCYYGYGPAGSLLRRNIFQEWYKAIIASQENTFIIEEPSVWHTGSVCAEDGETQKNKENISSTRRSLAEGCLSQYLRILELTNQRFPFSICQTGIYHPTNISSDTFLLCSSEYTGMTRLYFSPPSLSTQTFDNIQRARLKWWRQFSQNPSNFSLSDVKSDSGFMRTEIEYDFTWGKDSVECIVNRGDVELRQLEEKTGLSYQGKHGRKSVFPVTVECNTSLEKALLAFIVDAFTEKEKLGTKEKGTRRVLRINRHLTPYKVALAISGPGGRELREVANHLATELRSAELEVFDILSESSFSLENRLTRFDELGIPYSVILNATTLKDGIVGMRNRDTTLKEQVHVSKLKDTVWRNIKLS